MQRIIQPMRSVTRLLTGILALTAAEVAHCQPLKDVVAETLKTNPRVLAADAQRRAAVRDVAQARGGYFPTLDVNYATGRERTGSPDVRADEVTVGTGRVIPSSREQIIQSLEGGILAELAVREGAVVEKDQVLLRLDDTRFGASFRESRSRITALRAAVARLRAEAVGATPVFPADVRADQARIEMELFNSRRQQLDESIAALKRSHQLADDELQMTTPLVKKGLVSEVELLRLQRQVNELQGNLQSGRTSSGRRRAPSWRKTKQS